MYLDNLGGGTPLSGAGSEIQPIHRGVAGGLQLNRQIAYCGVIGKRREQYCLEQIRYMGVCHRKIGEDQAAYVKARGQAITCASGCSHCCQAVYVGATLQECEAIAYYLLHHESTLSNFLSSYSDWREKVKHGGDSFQKCENLFNKMMVGGTSQKKDNAFQEALRLHNEQSIVCPFLQNDLCSIYEVRPSNCAGFFVTHSPDLCKPQGSHSPRFNLTSIDDVMYDKSFYYKTLSQPITLYMPVAVYRLLQEGYSYLAQLPGLMDTAREALNDPEVLALIRSYSQ